MQLNDKKIYIYISCRKVLHAGAADLDDQLVFRCFPPALSCVMVNKC